MRILLVTSFVGMLCYFQGDVAAGEDWPDLSQPARAIGGGESDAAVVVGVENYFVVPGVPGAKSNANEWYQYLTETHGVAPQNVKLLTNGDATREEILGAARKAAGQAGAKGTLWFVFVGHGAPSTDGKDGLLVGVDAQQKAESLQSRSVRRGELLKTLAASRAGSIRVVLDACFSGRGQDGASIAPGLQPLVTVAAMGAFDPRMAVLTAAKGDQFAGALPGANRPAFSYLVLGGLRGWAAGADGKVTAGSLWRYTKNALSATLRGRDQTPDLIGSESALMAASAGEKGPSLAKMAVATAGGSASSEMFKVSNLAAVPRAQAPEAMTDMGVGADFRDLDIAGLKKYNAATVYDKSDASAGDKAAAWRELARTEPKFADKAKARAVQWDQYAVELSLAEEARRQRATARETDWGKLKELLPLEVVPLADKKRWASAFVKAYGKTSDDNPYLANLEKFLPAGTVKVAPQTIEQAPEARVYTPPSSLMDGTVAEVNGTQILRSEYQKEVTTAMEYWNKTNPAAMSDRANQRKLRESTLEQLIDRELLIQEGTKQNLKVREREIDNAVDEIKARFKKDDHGNSLSESKAESGFRQQLKDEGLSYDQFRDRLAHQILARKVIDENVKTKMAPPTEDEARAYFVKVQSYLRNGAPSGMGEEEGKALAEVAGQIKALSSERVRVQRILIRLSPGASENAKKRAQESAEAVKRRLDAGEEFARVAKEDSEDPESAARGGDLGYVLRGVAPPQLEKVAFSIGVGDTSGPIYTDSGYNIIRVTEKRPAEMPEYEKFKDELKNFLGGAGFQNRVEFYVKTLRNKANIVRNLPAF